MPPQVDDQLNFITDSTQLEEKRVLMAKHLARSKVSASFEYLCQLLTSPSRKLRQAGIISLRLLGDIRAIEILNRLAVQDNSSYLRGLAREAIRSLGGAPPGEPSPHQRLKQHHQKKKSVTGTSDDIKGKDYSIKVPVVENQVVENQPGKVGRKATPPDLTRRQETGGITQAPGNSPGGQRKKRMNVLWSSQLCKWTVMQSCKMEISPTGDRLVAASGYQDIFFFHQQEGLAWREPTGKAATALAASPNLQYIAAAAGSEVFLLDDSGRRLWSYQLPHQDYRKTIVTALDVQKDGGITAVGYSDGEMQFIDHQGNILWQAQFKEEPHILRFHPNGKGIAVIIGHWFSSEGHTVLFMDMNGREVWRKKIAGRVKAVDFIGKPGKLVLTTDSDALMDSVPAMLFCLDETGEIEWSHNLGGHGYPQLGALHEAVVVTLGQELAMLTASGEIFWKRQLKETGSSITSLAAAPGEDMVAVLDTASDRGGKGCDNVYIFNPQGKITWKETLPNSLYPGQVKVSHNGRYLATTSSAFLAGECVYFLEFKP